MPRQKITEGVDIDTDFMSDQEVSTVRDAVRKLRKKTKLFQPSKDKVTVRKTPTTDYGETYTGGVSEGAMHLDVGKKGLKPKNALTTIGHEGVHVKQIREQLRKRREGKKQSDPKLPSSQTRREVEAYQWEIQNRGTTRSRGHAAGSAYKQYKKLYKKAKQYGVHHGLEYPRR